MKKRVIFIMLLSSGFFWAQQGIIRGVITNNDGQGIQDVTITSSTEGTTTNSNGYFSLEFRSNKKTTLQFSHIGYQNITLELELAPNEIYEFNPVLDAQVAQFGEVIVRASQNRSVEGITVLSPETIRSISGANAGVENLLISLPGVNSNNELSTQYAVRGGNYDENLVYVNEIEIYRPQLVRSGQQEGLSFINPDLIQNVQFSAGGFQSKYGDKLSSVLDITYKNPKQKSLSSTLSLLGGSLSWEHTKNKLSAVTGIRYRDNSLLVDSKETETNFKPTFIDMQSYLSLNLSDEWLINGWASFSVNDYQYEPLTRQTNFGTLAEPKALVVFYDGNEKDRYQTVLGALKATYSPNTQNNYRAILSAYHSTESEHFDILAQYRLGEPNNNIGDNDLGDVRFTKAVGAQLTHGRNDLDALIVETKIKGRHIKNNQQWDWGVALKREDVRDRLVEWEVIDSAGFSIRPPSGSNKIDQPYTAFYGPIVPFQNVRATNNVVIERASGYLQWNKKTLLNNWLIWMSLGVRAQAWSISEGGSQAIFSPRGQISLQPKNKEHLLYRLAIGHYGQPPFYRELRTQTGTLNTEVKAQQSLHIVSGYEYRFKLWERPFVFKSEVYYKQLWDINPYTLENVRIRYQANNNAKAYAYGADLRLNGEFVPGTESWISVGLLKSQENINNKGYINRPTDQRLKFAMLFQDYVPSMPFLKMNLNLVYNTGLPGGSPSHADPYDYQLRLRDYKRVDLGIFYVIKDTQTNKNKLRAFKEFIIGFEIFNIFDVQNSITNIWVRDVSTQRQFGIPNYMTPRVFNLKWSARF